MSTLLLVLDLIGTFVFALSGATAGVKRRLDLFGVLVVSFAAGNFGGVTRDLMIGAVPPPAISDWRYLAVSLLAGLVTFWWASEIDRLRRSVLMFDAAGLALFFISVGRILLYMLTGWFPDIEIFNIPLVDNFKNAIEQFGRQFTGWWLVFFLIAGATAFLLSFRPWPVRLQVSGQKDSRAVDRRA